MTGDWMVAFCAASLMVRNWKWSVEAFAIRGISHSIRDSTGSGPTTIKPRGIAFSQSCQVGILDGIIRGAVIGQTAFILRLHPLAVRSLKGPGLGSPFMMQSSFPNRIGESFLSTTGFPRQPIYGDPIGMDRCCGQRKMDGNLLLSVANRCFDLPIWRWGRMEHSGFWAGVAGMGWNGTIKG